MKLQIKLCQVCRLNKTQRVKISLFMTTQAVGIDQLDDFHLLAFVFDVR